MKYFTKIALASLLLLATSVYAHEEEPEEVVVKPWEGAGELGFVNTTGNTESTALNMKLNFIRTGERWRHLSPVRH